MQQHYPIVLKPGDAAPDFVLDNADGKSVRLSSYSGRPIVLYFYPKDNTPGCTVEAKKFRDAYPDVSELGAEIIGVSLDGADNHCDFRDKHGLQFPLLADPDGRVHDLYDAWRTTLLGRNALGVRRCTFLIDEDGIIRRVYRAVNVWNHAAQVTKDLKLMVDGKKIPA